jgi:hypothetical protein
MIIDSKKRTFGKGGVCALAIAIVGVALLFLVGCGKSVEKEARDASTLEGVALKYWDDRLVTRNYQASYEFEMDKKSLSFEDYKQLVSRNENFKFSGLEVKTEEMLEDGARLVVSLQARMPNIPAPIERSFKDKWIYTDAGQWRHQFSKNQP